MGSLDWMIGMYIIIYHLSYLYILVFLAFFAIYP